MKGIIIVESTNDANERSKKLTFKNIPRFRLCISNINKTVIGNAENLDAVMPMYNLLQYNHNYSMT